MVCFLKDSAVVRAPAQTEARPEAALMSEMFTDDEIITAPKSGCTLRC